MKEPKSPVLTKKQSLAVILICFFVSLPALIVTMYAEQAPASPPHGVEILSGAAKISIILE